MQDVRDQSLFYSFIGTSNCNETATELLEYLSSKSLSPELKIVPEYTVRNLDTERFQITEDRDNFDYICSVKELAMMSGRQWLRTRRLVNLFQKNDFIFIRLKLPESTNQEKIKNCMNSWVNVKKVKSKTMAFENNGAFELETIALDRLLVDSCDILDYTLCYGVFVDGIMAGFCIGEISHKHFTARFTKANYEKKGTFQFLIRQTARDLLEQGITHWNFEEDMGLPSLRFAKSRYRPTHFLKKYTVRFEDAEAKC